MAIETQLLPPIDLSTNLSATAANKQLAEAHNDQRLADYHETSPRNFTGSISESATRFDNSYPKKEQDYLDAMTEQEERPDDFTRHYKRYKSLVKELLCGAIKFLRHHLFHSGISRRTARCLAGRCNAFPADLVVLNEAGRVTETSSVIAISRFSNASFFLRRRHSSIPSLGSCPGQKVQGYSQASKTSQSVRQNRSPRKHRILPSEKSPRIYLTCSVGFEILLHCVNVLFVTTLDRLESPCVIGLPTASSCRVPSQASIDTDGLFALGI